MLEPLAYPSLGVLCAVLIISGTIRCVQTLIIKLPDIIKARTAAKVALSKIKRER